MAAEAPCGAGGSHRVRAVLSFADGSTETLVLELDVR